MTTTIIITGTGIPQPLPGVAGAGVHVRYGDLVLQFDAGRNTAGRLTEVGVQARELGHVFITHHHSDHLIGLPDITITHWITSGASYEPLEVIAPEGPTTKFLASMLDPWVDDLQVRAEHVGRVPLAGVDITAFVPTPEPNVVWERGDVRVLAIKVHHEPVAPAVAYRVETPDGAVVISGDTRVCDEVATLAEGADLVIHEAIRKELAFELMGRVAGIEHIVDYHANSVDLGAMAQREEWPHLALTHLIPPPFTDEDREGFEADVRAGGYTGQVTVAKDLATFTLG